MPATAPFRLQQPSALLLAGALAQLATHLETSCPRAAHRARRLLDEIAGDDGADAQLRRAAHALGETIERDAGRAALHAGTVRTPGCAGDSATGRTPGRAPVPGVDR